MPGANREPPQTHFSQSEIGIEHISSCHAFYVPCSELLLQYARILSFKLENSAVGWLEFAVVVGCGLFGYMVVNAVIEYRRRRRGEESYSDRSGSERAEENTRGSNRREQEADKDYSSCPWWEVLKVDRNANSDQIKEAFRREISKYHPDRVEGLGIELRELADRKSKEVNLAYSTAKQQRHFS